jgi:hypothetical protein
MKIEMCSWFAYNFFRGWIIGHISLLACCFRWLDDDGDSFKLTKF